MYITSSKLSEKLKLFVGQAVLELLVKTIFFMFNQNLLFFSFEIAISTCKFSIRGTFPHKVEGGWHYCITLTTCKFDSDDMLNETLISNNGPWSTLPLCKCDGITNGLSGFTGNHIF